MRKSPYKHNVSGHFRSGKFIDNYDRGKGRKPAEPARRPSLGHGSPDTGFKVTFYYKEGRAVQPVKAGTFTEAVIQGFQVLNPPSPPRRVSIRRKNG